MAQLSTQVKMEERVAPQQIDVLSEILYIAKQHALTEHPLREADDYTKDLYITFLISLLQSAHGDTRSQQILIARIKEGSECTTDFQELIKKGKLITTDLYQEFCEQLQQSDLAKSFVIDALLIYGLQSNKELLEYISKIADHLGIEEQEMRALSSLSAAILSQDKDLLARNLDSIGANLVHGLCYIIDFVSELASDTVYFLANQKGTLKSENNYKSIILYKATVDIPSDCLLVDTDFILMKKCTLGLTSKRHSQGDTTINIVKNDIFEISRCKDFRMSDCTIFGKDNKSIQPISFVNCRNISLYNVSIKQLGITTENGEVNQLFYFGNIENLHLNKLLIENLSFIQNNSFYSSKYDNAKSNYHVIRAENIQHSLLLDSTICNVKIRERTIFSVMRIDDKGVVEPVIGIENIMNCKFK